MSPDWLLACAGLVVALGACAVACLRGSPGERLAGLEMASAVVTLLCVGFAQAMRRSSFFDLAVAVALLTFGGSFVFARFLERWL